METLGDNVVVRRAAARPPACNQTAVMLYVEQREVDDAIFIMDNHLATSA